jgi:hypothetical protein
MALARCKYFLSGEMSAQLGLLRAKKWALSLPPSLTPFSGCLDISVSKQTATMGSLSLSFSLVSGEDVS